KNLSFALSINPSSPYPETALPSPASGNRLLAGVLALMGEIHTADDGGERLETNEITRLSGWRRRQPDGHHRETGAEQRLDHLAGRLYPEMRASVGVALQIGEPIVERPISQWQRIRNIERTHLAGRNVVLAGDYVNARRKVSGPFLAWDVRDLE